MLSRMRKHTRGHDEAHLYTRDSVRSLFAYSAQVYFSSMRFNPPARRHGHAGRWPAKDAHLRTVRQRRLGACKTKRSAPCDISSQCPGSF